MFGLFPIWGYLNKAAVHILTWVFVSTYVFIYLKWMPRNRTAGLYGKFMSKLSEKLPNWFPKWLHHFTFPPAIYEVSHFSTLLPTLDIVCLSDNFFFFLEF